MLEPVNPGDLATAIQVTKTPKRQLKAVKKCHCGNPQLSAETKAHTYLPAPAEMTISIFEQPILAIDLAHQDVLIIAVLNNTLEFNSWLT